jgi:hypothetical protein
MGGPGSGIKGHRTARVHLKKTGRRSRTRKWELSGINAKVRRGVFRNKQGIMVGYSRSLKSWVSIPD